MKVVNDQEWEEYLESLPEAVRELTEKYYSHLFDIDGVIHYFIGVSGEGEALILSPVDPRVDHNLSIEKRVYACPCCLEAEEFTRH